jgi:hypothetical protein
MAAMIGTFAASRILLAGAALLLWPVVPAAARDDGIPAAGNAQAGNGRDDIDSEHIFGITEGSDVGDKGEKEVEVEPFGRFGKRGGTYAATSTDLSYKYTPCDNFRIAPVVSFASHNISDVPGLADVSHQWQLEAFGAEIRYRLLDRERDPFGLTLSALPARSRVDETTGQPVEQYGVDFIALLDRVLIPNRLFAALNLIYEPSWTRLRPAREWERDSTLGVGAALSGQIMAGVFVGMEARYFRKYEGIGLNTFMGEALFAGPSLYVKLPNHWFASAAWNLQVAGRAVGEPGSLDLTNFERHEVRLRVGTGF